MQALEPLPTSAAPSSGLQPIQHNVSVWRRELPSAIAAALVAAPVVPGCIDRVLRTGHAAGAPNVRAQLAPFTELVPASARAWFSRDLEVLTAAFQELSGASAFAACLSFVDSDSCRKFHVDHMRLRLLCTYRGPGTEWLADPDVDRSAFDLDDDDADAVNARIVRTPGAVQRAYAGDVVVLRGETWPGNAGRGAVHRSPPIVAQSLTRLVFKLSLR